LLGGTLDLDKSSVELKGKTASLRKYVDQWVSELMQSRRQDLFSKDDGRDVLEFLGERAFTENEFVIAGYPVKSLTLRCTTHLKKVNTTTVVSAFEIKTRGRVTNVEMVAEGATAVVSAIDVDRHHRAQ
jgi:hypothetical protein